MRNPSAKHHGIRSKFAKQAFEHSAEISSKLRKDFHRRRIVCRVRRDVSHFAINADAFPVSLLDRASRNEILNDSAFERHVPDFSPGWNTSAACLDLSINCKRRA